MSAAPVQTDRVVIAAEKLRKKIEAGRDVVVLDIRRDADESTDAQRLRGAHAVLLTTELVGATTPGSGNLPLPTETQIQDAVRRWGINDDSLVVAYSQEHPALAARAWWTLKWAGVPDVRVLDGGLDQWSAAGGALSSVAPEVGQGTFVVRTGALPTLDADGAAAAARAGVLFDARPPDAYTGTSGGGHIPGAQSQPVNALVGDDGRLADDSALTQLYRSAGVDGDAPVGAYCGGGTSATLTVLALAKIGISAALYPGSFSAWSSDPNRPVATGSEPG